MKTWLAAMAVFVLALGACSTMSNSHPSAYCSLSHFLPMKDATADWIAHNDPTFARNVRTHNATWLRECR